MQKLANFRVPCGGRALRFSLDDSRLAAASWNGTTRIWDLQSKNLIQDFAGQSDFPKDIQFTPDGKRLLVTCTQRVDLWDIESGRQLRSYGKMIQDVRTHWDEAEVSPDGSAVTLLDKRKRRFVMYAATDAQVEQDLIRLQTLPRTK